MFCSIRRVLRKIVFGPKTSSDSFVAYLREAGCTIGERTVFFSPSHTVIDMTRPWLISIGNDVQITHGVIILTHGYDWSVFKGLYGEVLGSSGGVTIDNNVFIGMNTIILKGVHIGENTIIGAGSVVTNDIPSNVVAAGNPCRVLMDLDHYHKLRIEAQEKEAKELVQLYREKFKRNPTEEQLDEYFWLFTSGNDVLHDSWKRKMKLVGTEEISVSKLRNNKKKYKDLSDFLDSVE